MPSLSLARFGKKRGHCGLHEAVFLIIILWVAMDSGWLHSNNIIVLPMVTLILYFLITAI